jgi:hypothetical protein
MLWGVTLRRASSATKTQLSTSPAAATTPSRTPCSQSYTVLNRGVKAGRPAVDMRVMARPLHELQRTVNALIGPQRPSHQLVTANSANSSTGEISFRTMRVWCVRLVQDSQQSAPSRRTLSSFRLCDKRRLQRTILVSRRTLSSKLTNVSKSERAPNGSHNSSST